MRTVLLEQNYSLSWVLAETAASNEQIQRFIDCLEDDENESGPDFSLLPGYKELLTSENCDDYPEEADLHFYINC